MPFFGMVNRDLFQRLSDLQLGDEKVILNHLLFITYSMFSLFFLGGGKGSIRETHSWFE